MFAAAVMLSLSVSVFASSIEDWMQKWDAAVSDNSVISVSPGENSTQLHFAWLEKIGADTAFRFGTSQTLTDADWLSVRESLTVTGHKRCSVTAANLRADTQYYYAYYRNGAWSETYSVRTPGDTLTTLFVTDAQLGRSGDWHKKEVLLHDVAGWDTTLNEAIRNHPDITLCLSAGDQAEIGFSAQQYRLFLAPQVLRTIPIATTIGNHEFYFPYLNLHFAHPNRFGSSAIHSLGDEPYYFEKGNVLFVVLDSNNPFSLDQQAVLEKAVGAYPDTRWRVVMMHHSLYSCEDTPDNGPTYLRKVFTPLFKKYGIDLVLSGHTHRYSRSKPVDGITYLEGGCCSGCNCKASPEVLPIYSAAGYPQNNPVYSVLRFDVKEISIDSFAVCEGESVLMDKGTVTGGIHSGELPKMSMSARILQTILSLFGRAVSLLFV